MQGIKIRIMSCYGRITAAVAAVYVDERKENRKCCDDVEDVHAPFSLYKSYFSLL
jgi:hypothetical protein